MRELNSPEVKHVSGGGLFSPLETGGLGMLSGASTMAGSLGYSWWGGGGGAFAFGYSAGSLLTYYTGVDEYLGGAFYDMTHGNVVYESSTHEGKLPSVVLTALSETASEPRSSSFIDDNAWTGCLFAFY